MIYALVLASLDHPFPNPVFVSCHYCTHLRPSSTEVISCGSSENPEQPLPKIAGALSENPTSALSHDRRWRYPSSFLKKRFPPDYRGFYSPDLSGPKRRHFSLIFRRISVLEPQPIEPHPFLENSLFFIQSSVLIVFNIPFASVNPRHILT
ncbi:hypothetical protein BDV12DRAFT_130068 [Aspergillus spectabilis]